LRLVGASEWQGFICAQVQIEYWSVSTRPLLANGLGRSIADTDRDLIDFEQYVALLDEPPDIAFRWRAIATGHKVIGRQVHDARLVAIMLAYGIRHILTLNEGDFRRYVGISSVHPKDVGDLVSG
jgi:predicted nucleic acid-binding protein